MKVAAYIKIKKDRSGGVVSADLSVSKFKPAAGANEVVALLNFDIPDVLFDKPVLEANIVVKAPPSTSVPTVTIDSGVLVDWIEKR